MLGIVFEIVFSLLVRGLGLATLGGFRRFTKRPPERLEDETLVDFVGVLVLVAVLAGVAVALSAW